jgi:tetratricopeptide (TPR) repeat protein
MPNKISVVSSVKKHKIRSAPDATAASRPSAVEKRQRKSDTRQPDPPYFSVVPGSWQLNSGIVFLCIVATAVLYAGDLRLGFFRIDDQQYVVSNPWIQAVTWKHLAQILSSPYYLNYSPLHLLSYALDYSVGGLSAYAFHLSSNLWAGVVAGFVYLVALALTQQRITAIVAALLFVVHPAHVEAVAWISSRKDLVAAAFVLLCVLAYLKYRQRGAIGWYIASLLLFLFALLGKLSVAAFPAVLVVLDLVLKKRPLSRSIIDKIPFLVLAAVVAVAVQYAQPSTGFQSDLAMHARAFVQSLWLLTGLGNYVIYRVPPGPGGSLSQLVGLGFLLGLFLLPLVLRKRYPVATVSIYWILFTYLPTQVLPFSYPVTDRYLFLPSVGAVILIAWLLIKATDHLHRWKVVAVTTLVTAVSFIWIAKTVAYLSEWQDPRSVWFAATRKSDDVHLYYELGWEYREKAASFGMHRRNGPLPQEEAKHYASVVWKDDPRLPQLLAELADTQHGGPVEKAFKDYLLAKASENFDEAVTRKGAHIIPDLFVSRGVCYLDKGDMESAKKEFLVGLDEASELPYSEGQQEALITCHYNLAVAEQGLGHSKEALSWVRLAEEEQDKLGRTVLPEITPARQKLESMATTLP